MTLKESQEQHFFLEKSSQEEMQLTTAVRIPEIASAKLAPITQIRAQTQIRSVIIPFQKNFWNFFALSQLSPNLIGSLTFRVPFIKIRLKIKYPNPLKTVTYHASLLGYVEFIRKQFVGYKALYKCHRQYICLQFLFPCVCNLPCSVSPLSPLVPNILHAYLNI
jgi:hypothetical protein